MHRVVGELLVLLAVLLAVLRQQMVRHRRARPYHCRRRSDCDLALQLGFFRPRRRLGLLDGRDCLLLIGNMRLRLRLSGIAGSQGQQQATGKSLQQRLRL
ncbi:hypothetical protein D3C71_1662320 [compost metagenome]